MVFLDQAPLRFTLKPRMPYTIVEAARAGVISSGVSIDLRIVGVSSYRQEGCPQKNVCQQLVISFQHTLHLKVSDERLFGLALAAH